MAEDKKGDAGAPEPHKFSEADKNKARAWFNKAADSRERREYDYAIELFITGLEFWPEAVDEGHMPLRSLAIQRHQAGGKKPGMMEGLRKSMTGKDAKRCMLNAEYLLSKDPGNASYMDGLLKNASKGGYYETLKWVAPLAFDSLKKDKKPDKGRFKTFRTALTEAAEQADALGDAATEVNLLAEASASLEYLQARSPGDEDLRVEQRDLAGKLAIARGKYDDADTFRDSLRDAEKQKILHDSERSKQSDETFDAVVAAARKEWEARPTDPKAINAYADTLLRRESKAEENEAIKVLAQAAEALNNYSYKLKADDVRLRQLERQTRQTVAQARKSGSDTDRQQARLAKMEQSQVEMSIYRERVSKYPTDLRLKYKFGAVLFKAREFDEAIPVLQVAQGDPRSRTHCQLLIGRSFFEKGSPAQAVEVLKELLETPDVDDDLDKTVTYWLARAFEADGRIEDAKAAYGKLLRRDYNFADGDARKRMENLK